MGKGAWRGGRGDIPISYITTGPNYFNLLHITADSYIIDALWPMYKNKIAWG